jgi:UDP-2,3-diacylglucosamine hydrolase
MKTLFLSDVHLKGPGDIAHEKIIHFFDRLGGREAACGKRLSEQRLILDHLVIAGDFFDFWFARGDAIYPGFQQVVERLVALKNEGVTISYCEGNHDFFLSGYFSGKLLMDVYPEEAELSLDGLRLFVSHGDTVDRENLKYRALRRFLRSRFARILQQLLPLAFLWKAACLSSNMSKEVSGESQDRLAEAMYRFSLTKFEEGYDAVILGHCHKPLLRVIPDAARPKTFVTLGDWIIHDSYLLLDDGRFSMQRFQQTE